MDWSAEQNTRPQDSVFIPSPSIFTISSSSSRLNKSYSDCLRSDPFGRYREDSPTQSHTTRWCLLWRSACAPQQNSWSRYRRFGRLNLSPLSASSVLFHSNTELGTQLARLRRRCLSLLWLQRLQSITLPVFLSFFSALPAQTLYFLPWSLPL